MRSSRSLVAGTLLATTLLTASAAAALASGPATVDRHAVASAWCFQDVTLEYCTTVEGFFQVVTQPGGRESATTHLRQRVVIREAGSYIAEYTTLTQDRFVFDPDGEYVSHEVTHTRAALGDLRCISTTVFRLADFDVVIDRSVVHCA
jgi:hypothetical protein